MADEDEGFCVWVMGMECGEGSVEAEGGAGDGGATGVEENPGLVALAEGGVSVEFIDKVQPDLW